jgi:hypothetical protein
MPGERPARLAFAATHVVKASRVLSWGEKAVWLESYALDCGPEGAWISNTGMGQRLGLEERTVKNYRTRLHKMGLLHPVPRPGARTVGWVACLPPAAIPHGRRGAGDVATALALALDGHLRTLGFGPPELKGHEGGAVEAPEEGPQRTQNRGRPAQAPSANEGGKGGALQPRSTIEDQLLPVVTEDGEDGDAGTPARRMEKSARPELVGDILKRRAVP